MSNAAIGVPAPPGIGLDDPDTLGISRRRGSRGMRTQQPRGDARRRSETAPDVDLPKGERTERLFEYPGDRISRNFAIPSVRQQHQAELGLISCPYQSGNAEGARSAL